MTERYNHMIDVLNEMDAQAETEINEENRDFVHSLMSAVKSIALNAYDAGKLDAECGKRRAVVTGFVAGAAMSIVTFVCVKLSLRK